MLVIGAIALWVLLAIGWVVMYHQIAITNDNYDDQEIYNNVKKCEKCEINDIYDKKQTKINKKVD